MRSNLFAFYYILNIPINDIENDGRHSLTIPKELRWWGSTTKPPWEHCEFKKAAILTTLLVWTLNRASLEFNGGIFIVFNGLVRKIHKAFSGLILWCINIKIFCEVFVGVCFYSRNLNRLLSGCLPPHTPTSDPHCHMWLFSLPILKLLHRKILDYIHFKAQYSMWLALCPMPHLNILCFRINLVLLFFPYWLYW